MNLEMHWILILPDEVGELLCATTRCLVLLNIFSKKTVNPFYEQLSPLFLILKCLGKSSSYSLKEFFLFFYRKVHYIYYGVNS